MNVKTIETMNEYLTGEKLYGDDFSLKQIQSWFDDESHGFDELEGEAEKKSNEYEFHRLNWMYGFSKFQKNMKFHEALGIGSAWGYEFEPYIDKIQNITIIEPSDILAKNKIGRINPDYVKPNVSGKIDMPDNMFDLITCFGTLHHIPNVSFVLTELIRVLKQGGFLLIREPINSMGDWTKERKGLTKRERGIAPHIFEKIFAKNNIRIVSKNYMFTGTFALQRILNKFSNKYLIKSSIYLHFDKILSKWMAWNYHYHAQNRRQRLAPQNVFYVVTKDCL